MCRPECPLSHPDAPRTSRSTSKIWSQRREPVPNETCSQCSQPHALAEAQWQPHTLLLPCASHSAAAPRAIDHRLIRGAAASAQATQRTVSLGVGDAAGRGDGSRRGGCTHTLASRGSPQHGCTLPTTRRGVVLALAYVAVVWGAPDLLPTRWAPRSPPAPAAPNLAPPPMLLPFMPPKAL